VGKQVGELSSRAERTDKKDRGTERKECTKRMVLVPGGSGGLGTNVHIEKLS